MPAAVSQLGPLQPGISSAGKPRSETSILLWKEFGMAPTLTAKVKTQQSLKNMFPYKTHFGCKQPLWLH